MKKRTRWYLLLLLIPLAAVVLTVYLTSSHEPTYNDRKMGEWLDDLVSDDPAAMAAVRAIGTNGIPYLLRGLSYEHSEQWQDFIKVLDKLLREKLRLSEKPIGNPALMRYIGTMKAFKVLGPEASNAVPGLSAMLERPETVAGAAFSLAYIGPAGLPGLMGALTNGLVTAKYHALRAIPELGINAAPAFPLVAECLNDTNMVYGVQVRYPAILTMGRLQEKEAEAIPLLMPLTTNADNTVRTLADQALREIDGRQKH